MIRSERYLNYMREKACCVCSLPGRSDPHHFGSGRGTGQKVSDTQTVPLCRKHHDEYHRARKCSPYTQEETELLFWRTAFRLLQRFLFIEGFDKL